MDAQFKNNQLLRRRMAIMQRAPDQDQTPQAQPTSDPPTPTMSVPHGYAGNGKFLHPQSQSPPTQGPHSAAMIAAQQAEQMAQTQRQTGVGSGYGPMMAAGMPMQQRMMMQQMGQQMGNPMGNPNHMMDQGNFRNPTMFMNEEMMYRHHQQQQQQQMMAMQGVQAGGMDPMCMPPQQPGSTSASNQMQMLIAKMNSKSTQQQQKEMPGTMKNPQVMSALVNKASSLPFVDLYINSFCRYSKYLYNLRNSLSILVLVSNFQLLQTEFVSNALRHHNKT